MDDERARVDAWRSGDRAAGHAVVERYYDPIKRFFRTKAGAAADELVQQTFLACAESLDRLRDDTSFRAFLFGIARNKLFEHIRGRVRDRRIDPDFGVTSIHALDPGVSTAIGQRDERRLLVLGLQRIPADLQIALELFYWEELSIAELAQVLDVPAGTVKSRLFRARQLLRAAMEEVPATDDDHQTARSVVEGWDAVAS